MIAFQKLERIGIDLFSPHLVLFAFFFFLFCCADCFERVYRIANIKEIEVKRRRKIAIWNSREVPYTIQKVLHVK